MPQALLGAVIAFAVSLLLTSVLVVAGNRFGWVALPRPDRWHQRPTALYGGVGIFVALLVAAAVVIPSLAGRVSYEFAGLLLGGVLTFAIGLRDDIRAVNAIVKLTGQVVACIVFLVGLGLQFAPGHSELFLLTLPVAILWMLGLTNGFNLLDNMDGLTAGTSLVVGTILSLFLSLAGVPAMGAVAAIAAGASAGFLVFNFQPKHSAKIFMGDCGSMVLGYMLAGLALIGAWKLAGHGMIQGLAVPILIMAVPIFDTTLVTVRRKVEGRSISHGGKDHSSHRLVYAGLSEKQAVLVLWALSAVAGGTALGVWKLDNSAVSIGAVAVFTVALGLLGSYLSRFAQKRSLPAGFNNSASSASPLDGPSPAGARVLSSGATN
ncbi:MAG: undecaprenyl/decaprenyl-phosphate alpha-N-acetylglucosaminyl 1-phosphate transferase [Candidatus Sericytochromatia bacterium]|nr:undecaprenyl/decaprenyl-phosphate alpha-N-acetylglucosaminyl 1-phosphate transferase [Candidatus Tanganyikabacteria bacterium]